jgi:hypothetical protein
MREECDLYFVWHSSSAYKIHKIAFCSGPMHAGAPKRKVRAQGSIGSAWHQHYTAFLLLLYLYDLAVILIKISRYIEL